MGNTLPVTITIINYRTPDLTERAANSCRAYYPEIPMLVVDNGSRDGSEKILDDIRKKNPGWTDIVVNDRNLHHGPAMDQALQRIQSRYVLFLDSDVEIERGRFLELMVNIAEKNTNNYAVGHRVFMNKRGFEIQNGDNGFPYIRPYCMLIKRELYMTLPKFERHGAPCLDNMRAAFERGCGLLDFPVKEYVAHAGRGTAHRFGYQLGVRGKVNYVMNKLGL